MNTNYCMADTGGMSPDTTFNSKPYSVAAGYSVKTYKLNNKSGSNVGPTKLGDVILAINATTGKLDYLKLVRTNKFQIELGGRTTETGYNEVAYLKYSELNNVDGTIRYSAMGNYKGTEPGTGTTGKFYFDFTLSKEGVTETLGGLFNDSNVPASDHNDYNEHAIESLLTNSNGNQVALVKYCYASGKVYIKVLKPYSNGTVSFGANTWIYDGAVIPSGSLDSDGEPRCL